MSDFAWDQHPPLQLCEALARVRVLDQTLLPFELRYLELATLADCVEAIRAMKLRGAPLIGVAAAAGIALAMSVDSGDAMLEDAVAQLLASRPTAVNLRGAVESLYATLRPLAAALRPGLAWQGARALQQQEHASCARIGEHGLALLTGAAARAPARARGWVNVLTHCNAGWLATGAWGTALAPVYRAAQAGIAVHVWVDETRPRNQGARLTTWELARAGIAHTLVADSAAGQLMQCGEVDLCLVGADRATRTGDVCNKIGTYQKALAAADNDVPFYVALPVSTIDWRIEQGLREIPIEQREASELLRLEGLDAAGAISELSTTAPGTAALNRAFDVTPARLVTGLVCEHGIFGADAASLLRLRDMAGAAVERV